MEVLSDSEGLLKYRYGSTRTFYRFQTEANGVPQGVPATATEMSEDSIRFTVKILVCNFELQCPSTIASRAAETLLLRASTKL